MSEDNKANPAPTVSVKAETKLEIPPVEPVKVDELATLKNKADTLGINYPNNIGVDALRAKINEKLNPVVEKKPEPEVDPAMDQETLPLNEVTDPAVLRRRIYEENMYLVRCRISNLNPAKKDIPGEFVTVHNKYLGTVKKYIPFGEATDNGYHVPKIILEALKARKFLSMKTKRNKVTGADLPVTQWVKEFAIEELPPLTKEELEQLARQQAAAKGM